MKKTILLSVAAAAGLILTACSAAPVAVLENGMQVDGRDIYLRGEMNDYAVMSAYRLVETGDDQFCADAPLRSDWSPYRFKFADAAWSRGSNFGYAQPPGVLREGDNELKLNPDSRFEEVRYYPTRDGVYRFCLLKKSSGYFVQVTRRENGSLNLLGSLFEDEKEE